MSVKTAKLETTFLDGNGYIVPTKDLTPEKLKDILTDLTVYVDSYLSAKRKIVLYSKELNGYHVPRLYGIANFGIPKLIRMSEGISIAERVSNVTYKLADFQVKCMNYILSNYYTPKQISEGSAGCICDLPCGRGKTLMGLDLIVRFKRRALIVCHACSPVKQWIEHFNKFVPNAIVKKYKGELEMTSDVVVITVHRLARHNSKIKHTTREYNAWFGTFGTVVFDEIHAYGSDENSTVFDLVYPRHLFGLSATPERIDWMEKIYGNKVGPIIYSTERLGIETPKFNGCVRLVDPPIARLHPDGSDSAAVIKAMTLNLERLRELLETIKFQFLEDPSVSIIVACNYIAEVDLAYDRIAPPLSAMNRKVRKAYSDMLPEQVSDAADEADVLIGTYSKIGTGFSVSKYTSIHIWSPTRQKHKQMIGRICRWRDGDKAHNTKTRIVYDWIDRQTIAASQYFLQHKENSKIKHSRRENYLELGWQICCPADRKSQREQSVTGVVEYFKELGLE